jgi:hypothetical protein
LQYPELGNPLFLLSQLNLTQRFANSSLENGEFSAFIIKVYKKRFSYSAYSVISDSLGLSFERLVSLSARYKDELVSIGESTSQYKKSHLN